MFVVILYQRKRDSEGVENTFPVMGYPEQPPEPGITRPEFAFARQGIAMTSVLALEVVQCYSAKETHFSS